MAKESAGWLIVRTLGIVFLFYAAIGWVEVATLFVFLTKWLLLEKFVDAHLDPLHAATLKKTLIILAKTSVASIVCAYLLFRGRSVHRALMREGIAPKH
jgi:hypothetical protein